LEEGKDDRAALLHRPSAASSTFSACLPASAVGSLDGNMGCARAMHRTYVRTSSTVKLAFVPSKWSNAAKLVTSYG
jgi:hypothetical protein